jgi:porin
MARKQAAIALVCALVWLGWPACALPDGRDRAPSVRGDAGPSETADFEFPWVNRGPVSGTPPRFFPIGPAQADLPKAPADDWLLRIQELLPLEASAGMPTLSGEEPPFSAFANVDPGRTPPGGATGGAVGGYAVSGNPAAVNIVAGTGRLGDVLGINHDGWRLGGLTIGDANGILSGGLGPGKWTGNNLTIADLSLDLEKRFGWKGGMFGIEYLYVTSGGPGYTVDGIVQGRGDPNALAGSLMGFNSLVGPRPLSRSQLYELWFRQALFNDRYIFRIGKSVPTFDFNNVVRAVPLRDQTVNIAAISSLLFTPLYVNPTLLGIIPGYYNSATGTVNAIIPTDNTYFQYGFFDGNVARGRQTGLEGPHFNGYWLHLLEAGGHWELGRNEKPGKFGVGAWFQTGNFKTFSGHPFSGAQGIYLFGTQRLYWENRKKNNNGLTSFFQFGATNTDLVFIHRYFGTGLTYFGPIPGRDDDSCGFGVGYGTTNGDPDAASVLFTLPKGTSLRETQLGRDEILLSWYYQMKIRDGIYFQPNLTEVVDPGRHAGIPDAFAITLRLLALF